MILRIIIFIIILAIIFFVVIPLVLYISGVTIFPGTGISPVAPPQQTNAPERLGILIRSEDTGTAWKHAAISEDPNVAFPTAIYSIAVHPKDNNILYLGGKASGLWKSINQGRTWNQVTDASHTLDSHADIYDIKIISTNLDSIYVAAYQKNHGRILKSEDSGAHFTEMYATSADNAGVFSIVIDPTDTNHLLAVTGEGTLIETINSGQTWRVKKLFTRPLMRLIANPGNIQELYIINAEGSLFKSVTGGKDWSDPIGALPSENVGFGDAPTFFDFFTKAPAKAVGKIFFLDPSDSSRAYLVQDKRLLRSEDAGLTWQDVTLLFPQELLPLTALAVDPRKRSTIFAAVGNELHQSTDDGTTWRSIPLPADARITSLIIHPNDSHIMFAVIGK